MSKPDIHCPMCARLIPFTVNAEDERLIWQGYICDTCGYIRDVEWAAYGQAPEGLADRFMQTVQRKALFDNPLPEGTVIHTLPRTALTLLDSGEAIIYEQPVNVTLRHFDRRKLCYEGELQTADAHDGSLISLTAQFVKWCYGRGQA